jgi:lysozyme family protein
MAKSKLLIPYIQKWEGGWSNDPVDPGGATMKGITLRTYKQYCKNAGLPEPTMEDLKNISDENWDAVFKTMFWDIWKGDEIVNQTTANLVVDWLWNSGIYGIKIPQRILGVVQDGLVGPKTIAAINTKFNPVVLIDLIHDARAQYYTNLVDTSVRAFEAKKVRTATEKELLRYTQKRFLAGWLNRINDLKNS